MDNESETRVLAMGDQDATMMDLGERARPPGDPPDGQRVRVRNLMGSNSVGMPRPEEVLDDAFVTERVCLEFPNGEDGEPVVTIGYEVLEAMYGLWKNCMIVKMLRRNVSVSVLSKRLREMWKPVGKMAMLDLPRNFFMIRFDVEAEYMAALTGGPWRVFGSYLLTQAWTPESILMSIAKGFGKPLKFYLNTLNVERARFARVCVEVNLKRPLKGTVMVNGERYFVSYEGLSAICSRCGMYGHLVHN
ncbi:PREDICTED: uncharacterized protein LOC104709398 [Camelina sativa]|uniref:Uncharacterized protein LOC104709398 n=1 Tax=Camelina sativa TaxID=90675 RepID=A0ABM0TCR6_CAMSA|nr:PREDICTED: uncharacterized protein LOC104709398 [Camelina sativa]